MCGPCYGAIGSFFFFFFFFKFNFIVVNASYQTNCTLLSSLICACPLTSLNVLTRPRYLNARAPS